MSTWLLTWNPKRGSGASLGEVAQQVQRGRRVKDDWSCGRTKSIVKGDRLFLLRQGKEPRGLVGLATALRSPAPGRAWRGSPSRRNTLYVDFVWDSLVDSETQPVLPTTVLQKGRLAQINWRSQISGIHISDALSRQLQMMWAKHVRSLPDRTLSLSDVDEVSAFEGKERKAFVKQRKREARLRLSKIESVLRDKGRLVCEVPGCSFDFAVVYGKLGKGFAHVHHRKQLSASQGERRVTLSDLSIVCPNCHAMIHRGGKCRQLNSLIRGRRLSGSRKR